MTFTSAVTKLLMNARIVNSLMFYSKNFCVCTYPFPSKNKILHYLIAIGSLLLLKFSKIKINYTVKSAKPNKLLQRGCLSIRQIQS